MSVFTEGTPAVSVREITKSYGRELFSPVSFTLAPGEGIGVTGHNGCGKSTLLDIIAGITKPASGAVLCPVPVGYVMQGDGLSENLTCYDNLLLEAALCGHSGAGARKRVKEAAQKCAVGDFLGKRVSKCSGGMKTRVAIAAALLASPGLMLLDEAFAPLDAEARDLVSKLFIRLKAEGAAFVCVSHNKDDFSGLCERVLKLPEAEIFRL